MSPSPLVPAGEVASSIAALAQPVAVTGGTGFVGSHLVETLAAAGVRPRVLVRNAGNPRWIGDVDVERIAGSLAEEASLRRLVDGAATVFHLAGVVRAGRREVFEEANVGGTARLVQAVLDTGAECRIVHVSSLAAAGPSPSIEGVGPEDPPRPVSVYGRSKLGGEQKLRELAGNRPWVILRPPAIYGPRDVDILDFFKLASRGLVPIPSGERWLTLSYVGDVVRAILAAGADAVPAGGVFHLGEPQPYRMAAVVHLLAEAGGVSARVLPVPGGVVRTLGAGGSLLQRIGFSGVAMTADKARELLARHWTSRTADSLEGLGITEWVEFFQGARTTWSWYRGMGWVR
jgi:nucleoside-diphosphate-sugar epimerase